MTLLTNKMGVPRHAFLAFLNNGVMGSMFTRYKSPALVNCDWTTTFTPELLRKDLDLGLELGREMDVPLPVTAAAREVLQSHFGAAMLQKDPGAYLEKDFAALAETMALASGMKLESENKNVPTGLESEQAAACRGLSRPTRPCQKKSAPTPNRRRETDAHPRIAYRDFTSVCAVAAISQRPSRLTKTRAARYGGCGSLNSVAVITAPSP